MANPICPNCQRQMVVANPQFCPFCGQQFVAQTSAPAVDLAANPYAEIPPVRSVPVPMSFPMLNRATPASALVLNRQRMPLFTTTWARAVGITAGIVTVALVAVVILVQNLLHPNQTIDQWLSTEITGVAWESSASATATYGFYTTFMQLIIAIIPMTAVIAYWFSLRRLFQEWAPWVWLKTFLLSTVFIVAAMLVQATLIGDGGLMLNFVQAYPGATIFEVIVAALCSGAGIVFGYYFARWPIERIRALNSNVWQDLGLTVLVGIAGTAAQFVLYDILAFGVKPFANGFWWLPIAAIGVAIYACWSALRPVKQPVVSQPAVGQNDH